MSNALIKGGAAAGMISAEERRAQVLARVKAMKEEGAVYQPFTGGVNYIRLNGNTGELSFGKDNREIPASQRFIVPLEEATHGVSHWYAKKKTEEKIVKYLDGPAPAFPPGAIIAGSLPPPDNRNGWQRVVTIKMIGLGGDLDKIMLEFDGNNTSKINALTDLLGEMTAMCDTSLGEQGFFNAVVEMSVDSYYDKNNSKDVYFPVFTIVGWTDGFTVREVGQLAPPEEETSAGDGMFS